MTMSSDSEGIEADDDVDVLNPCPLELTEDISEQGLSAQIQERLVLTIAQILKAGAETRGGNESFHLLLLKAFRSLGPTVQAVGPPQYYCKAPCKAKCHFR